MFLLDTNSVSELRKAKAGKADKNVKVWANNVADFEHAGVEIFNPW